MPLVNSSKREINVKIVYAGLPAAGKGANLTVVYQRLKPEFRGQSRTIPMGDSVMHLCEFQPPGAGAIPGFSLRYHLYTLAGTAIDDPQWRMVLKGADGIVFVVSADPAQGEANRAAFVTFVSQVNSLGLDLSQVPIVVQANQQGVAAPLGVAEVQQLLAVPGLTIVPAQAERGEGVLETLTAVVRKVSAILQRQEFPQAGETEVEADIESPDDEDESSDIRFRRSGQIPVLDAPADDAVAEAVPVPSEGALTLDGAPLEIPLTLAVSGVERQFVLTVSIREANTTPCEPLRGAGYAR